LVVCSREKNCRDCDSIVFLGAAFSFLVFHQEKMKFGRCQFFGWGFTTHAKKSNAPRPAP
jgi:hypothetical protein